MVKIDSNIQEHTEKNLNLQLIKKFVEVIKILYDIEVVSKMTLWIN